MEYYIVYTRLKSINREEQREGWMEKDQKRKRKTTENTYSSMDTFSFL